MIGPLIRFLCLAGSDAEDKFAIARVRQLAASARHTELETLFRAGIISQSVYDQFRNELEKEAATLRSRVVELYSGDSSRAESEIRTARMRLAAAEQSSIESAVREGFISAQSAAKLLDKSGRDGHENEGFRTKGSDGKEAT
jgi:hypothetical protein